MNSTPEFPMPTQSLEDLALGLSDIVKKRLESAARSDNRFILHMLGIPGAGKTSIAKLLKSELERATDENVSYLAFDELMSEIPAYRNTSDPLVAFSQFEIPARSAGYSLLQRLLCKEACIVFDHGGAAPQHIEILQYAASALDYYVFVVHVSCDVEVAAARVEARTKKEGRHTPLTYLTDRKTMIDSLIPQYIDLAASYTMIDNTSLHPDRYPEIVSGIVRIFRAYSHGPRES